MGGVNVPQWVGMEWAWAWAVAPNAVSMMMCASFLRVCVMWCVCMRACAFVVLLHAAIAAPTCGSCWVVVSLVVAGLRRVVRTCQVLSCLQHCVRISSCSTCVALPQPYLGAVLEMLGLLRWS